MWIGPPSARAEVVHLARLALLAEQPVAPHYVPNVRVVAGGVRIPHELEPGPRQWRPPISAICSGEVRR